METHLERGAESRLVIDPVLWQDEHNTALFNCTCQPLEKTHSNRQDSDETASFLTSVLVWSGQLGSP